MQCRLCREDAALEEGAMCEPCQGESDDFWTKFNPEGGAGWVWATDGGGADEGVSAEPRPDVLPQMILIVSGAALAWAGVLVALWRWEYMG
jgi:hypothetical protein